MKFLMKSIMLVSLLILQTQSIFTQECKLPPDDKNIKIENVEKRNSDNYKDWKKYITNNLTFYAPADLKDLGKRCYEGGECWNFGNDKIIVSISTDRYSYYPTFEKGFPEYSEKLYCISGIKAWYWYYPDRDKKDIFYSGVYFYFDENPKRRLVMIFNLKDKDLNQVTEKIVKSIEIIK